MINNKFRSLFLISLIGLSFFVVVMTSDCGIGSQNNNDLPIIENNNLRVDGSITPVSIIPNRTNFNYITRFTFIMEFQTNARDWDKFGDDIALTNGIAVNYANVSLFPNNIVCNYCFTVYTYDYSLLSDDKNPKSHVFNARISFDKFTEHGIKINSSHYLEFVINDNITALTSISLFLVNVQGCKNCFSTPQTVSVINTVAVSQIDTSIVYTTGITPPNTTTDYFVEDMEVFFYDKIGSLKMKNLRVGSDYALLLGANLAEINQFWHNFTATSNNYEYHFKMTETDESIVQLDFKLYQDDEELDLITMSVVKPSEYNIIGSLPSLFPGFVVAFFLMAVILAIFNRDKIIGKLFK